MMDLAVWITLFDRHAAACGVTLVDASDAEWVGQWRWRLGGRANRYAERGEHRHGRYKHIYLHRVLLDQQGEVDHINRNTFDNRRCNLRIVTHQGNQQNTGGNPKATSQYRGVHFEKWTGRWRAVAKLGGITYRLGRFDTELEAHRVVSDWRRQHMPYTVEDPAV